MIALYGASKNHPDIANSYNNLGNVHGNMGDYTRALEYHSKSLNMKIALYGACRDHPDVGRFFYYETPC